MLQFFLGFLRGVIERGVHCQLFLFYEGFLTVFPYYYHPQNNYIVLPLHPLLVLPPIRSILRHALMVLVGCRV
jgi:hypothetical protein